jgi:energy-coupling factor transport system substrate-specific component
MPAQGGLQLSGFPHVSETRTRAHLSLAERARKVHATIASTTARPSRNLRWRVVDIVVAAVLGVASGVIFWAWGLASNPLGNLFVLSPGLSGLLNGGWLFAGVLGAIVIRKPGAALYTEILAAVVEMLIGSQWGFSTLISGIVQGLGAEIIFALFLYANWRFGVALLAGAGAAIGGATLDITFGFYAGQSAGFTVPYLISSVVSGVVIAGLLSWLAMKGLAKTGALNRFASGREAAVVDESAA